MESTTENGNNFQTTISISDIIILETNLICPICKAHNIPGLLECCCSVKTQNSKKRSFNPFNRLYHE